MPGRSQLAGEWALDPEVDFLNHGSFGACPRVVLEHQQRLRIEMERQPVAFLGRRIEPLLDEARAALAAFVGADADGLVVVPNATTGVSTVLRSLESELGAGDELLTTDHAYEACRNALDFLATRTGARLVVVALPFPVTGDEALVEEVLRAVTPRTRIALLDHVTSATALVLPVARLVRELAGRGVETMIDGAHAPGMLPLRVAELGAAWYTGNCHKWISAPKASAFLWAREDRRAALRPLVTSHGYRAQRPGRSRLHDQFDWQGTGDPTAFLAVPAAIRFFDALLPGGWPEVMRRNHELAVAARDAVLGALGGEAPIPDGMLGSMAALPLPDEPVATRGEERGLFGLDPLQRALIERGFEVPVSSWPARPRRVLRVSAQLYNDLAQYDRLAGALRELLAG